MTSSSVETDYVLVIDDEVRYRELYAETLRAAGFAVRAVPSAEDALAAAGEAAPLMVVSDVRMPGIGGIRFLERLGRLQPSVPCLLITGYADVREAVEALKLGAIDYLEKPVDLDELVAAVRDALGVRGEAWNEDIPGGLLTDVIAESDAMRSVLRDAYRVARSDATVLLTGESGVGKEVVAQFVHRASRRASAPFVALNCAALPPHLLASELFGHERGAFTGAVASRKGIFREADHGTLFLDEIGDMPADLQPALLRAIESGHVPPIGSDGAVTVDVRLVAATNRALEEAVEQGEFREDLYYRLNVIALETPPLRERRTDILPLARYLLARRLAPSKRLSPQAAEVMEQYHWPGNVRELANAIERAAILSNAEVILPEHLPPVVCRPGPGSRAPGETQVRTISEVEEDAIRAALAHTDGNRTQAAELLGISRRALIYKLKRMEL